MVVQKLEGNNVILYDSLTTDDTLIFSESNGMGGSKPMINQKLSLSRCVTLESGELATKYV